MYENTIKIRVKKLDNVKNEILKMMRSVLYAVDNSCNRCSVIIVIDDWM